MKQKHIEKIDIERNKELFAYEMTEVLLMLQGEFANVSGKDLGLDDCMVSKERLNAPLEALAQGRIPTIEVTPVCISKALAVKLAVPPEMIKQREQEEQEEFSGKLKFEVPVIPSFEGLYCPQALTMEEGKPIAVPNAEPVAVPTKTTVTFTAPEVALPTVAEIPKFKMNEISLSKQTFAVPAVGSFPWTAPTMEWQPTVVAVPAVPAFAQVVKSAKDDSGSSIKPVMTVTVPKAPQVTLTTVTYTAPDISVPSVPKAAELVDGGVRKQETVGEKTAAVMPQVSIPDIPQFVQPQITVEPAVMPVAYTVPSLPDMAKEREEILAALKNN